jgi:Caspase domain
VVVLIYYSGHGFQFFGESFVLPVDVKISSGQQVRSSCISLTEIQNDMSGLKVSLKILLIDACRNPFNENSVDRSGRSINVKGLRLGFSEPHFENFNPQKFVIAYSTALGRRASDKSSFASSLISNIYNPALSLSGLLFQVQQEVQSSSAQTPFVTGTANASSFYFKKTESIFFRTEHIDDKLSVKVNGETKFIDLTTNMGPFEIPSQWLEIGDNTIEFLLYNAPSTKGLFHTREGWDYTIFVRIGSSGEKRYHCNEGTEPPDERFGRTFTVLILHIRLTNESDKIQMIQDNDRLDIGCS